MSYDFTCMLCGGVFDGEIYNAMPEKPDFCPVCGAPKSDIVAAAYAEESRRINAKEEE